MDMGQLCVGGRVRIDIPDETDPDHEMYHGKHGEILVVISDNADDVTGDEQDSGLYRIHLDNGDTFDA
jgi:hypothetical protein